MKIGWLKNSLIFVGTLLVMAALCLTVYNVFTDRAAGKATRQTLEMLHEVIGEPSVAAQEEGKQVWDEVQIQEPMEMTTISIANRSYCGEVEIPAIGISLPVSDQWSLENAASSVCRYTGSAAEGDLVIAGHNYQSHFKQLNCLLAGDRVFFTDVNGTVYPYTVLQLETVGAYDVEQMLNGDWDLTLFTCTVGGEKRIAVRCAKSGTEV